MLRNFFVTTIRIAFKQKLNTFLNILGLAIAIAVSMILIMHIRYELSFDKHITDYDRVFRITNESFDENGMHWATSSTPLFYELKDFFPEIENTLRVFDIGSNSILGSISENEEPKQFEEQGAYCVDTTVFDVFSIEVLKGDPNQALSDLRSIVITESIAKKHFGTIDVIGKQLFLNAPTSLFTISAVIKDCPKTTHWQYSFFIPEKMYEKNIVDGGYSDLFYSRGWSGCYNYIKLKENTSIESVKERLADFRCHYLVEAWDMTCEEISENGAFGLQPLADIHLKSNLEEEMAINGNYTYVIVFILSTIFILIVAAVNYINIAISLSLKRMKEIGVKKINGSNQRQLRMQFMGEAFLTTIIAAIIAVLLIDLILPLYNSLSGQEFYLSNLFIGLNPVLFLAIVFSIGIFSGLYPAFFITRFNTIDALKGLKDPTNKSNRIRKVLLVFQFVVSIFMVFVTIGIYTQMNYLRNSNMGFDKDNLMYVDIDNSMRQYVIRNSDAFKNELKALPFVTNVAYAGDLPGERYSVENLRVDGRDPNSPSGPIRFIRVGKDYVKTMGLEIIDGTDFLLDNPQESRFILTKKTAEFLGPDNLIQQRATSMFGGEGEIVGVVNDHHFASLHQEIEPVVLEYNLDELVGWNLAHIMIRVSPGNLKEQMEQIKETILQMEPEAVISIGFVDDYIHSLYVTETKMGDLFKGFTLFTIFIACLGLFGITAYNAELKTKEVGIRKAMGASQSSIVNLLSVKFILFLLFSFAIAIPLGYLYINNWLNNFAYHTTISVWSILFTIVLGMVIAYVTVIYHAISVSSQKPADVLKYE